MTVEVQPRIRTRSQPVAPVEPPARRRVSVPVQVSPPPRTRTEVKYDTPPNGPTHNGYKGPGQPDPRFAPLRIVTNSAWFKALPEYITEKLRLALEWQVGDPVKPKPGAKHHSTPVYLAPSYLTERALRRYLHVALLSDEVYEALEVHLIENFTELNDAQGKIMRLVDGEIEVSFATGVGPFYLDQLPAIECHYKNKLRPVQPGAY